MNLVLRELTEHDEVAFLKGAEEWQIADLSWYSFDWRPGGSYSDLLEKLRKNAAGIDVPSSFVPSTMLYAFVNGEIAGRLNVRHVLNEALRHRGGHVGYSVAPRFRRRGYATEIMKQGIAFCRRLGIDDIMITCADTNVPSWKVIEHVGGILQDRIFDDKTNEMTRRYWIRR